MHKRAPISDSILTTGHPFPVNATELADLDAIIYRYATASWPRYTEEERRADPEWNTKLIEAQSRAVQRHRMRVRGQHAD